MAKTERIQCRVTDLAYQWLQFKKVQTGAEISTTAGIVIAEAARRDKEFMVSQSKSKKNA